MGQYYDIVTYTKDEGYKVYDRSTKKTEDAKPEYMLAKIMEHSWINNTTLASFSNIIYHSPMKIAWVGDYSDDVEHYTIANFDVLTEEKVIDLHAIAALAEGMPMLEKEFDNTNKILVNHSKKVYIDMNKYLAVNSDNGGWCIHPLPLLTALGNGLGGGDYQGINMSDIGLWAFDTISFEDLSDADGLLAEGFEKIDYEFRE